MPTIYDEIIPGKEATPATEMACLILAGVLAVTAVVAFGIARVAEFVSDFWRKKAWRMRLIA